MRLASSHGTLPLLYWGLNLGNGELIPPEVRLRLQHHLQRNAVRNQHLARELLCLVDLLESQGIVTLPFKGIVLGQAAYGNLALRELCDLDLLVRRQDVPRAIELICSREYEFLTEEPAETPDFVPDERYNHHLYRRRDAVMVELHWRFTRRFGFDVDLDTLLSGLIWTPLAGTRVRGLRHEELLLILSVHGTKHCWAQLKWVCDIAELIRNNPEIDWSRLLVLSRQYHIRRTLLLSLRLASDCLGAPVPADTLALARRGSAVGALAEQVREWLFASECRSVPYVPGSLFYLRSRERFVDRARQFRDLLDHLSRNRLPEEIDSCALLKIPAGLRSLGGWLRRLRGVAGRGRRQLQYRGPSRGDEGSPGPHPGRATTASPVNKNR